MADADPYTPVTLDAIGESIEFDFRTVAESVCMTCRVTGTVTYVIEISNDERTTRTFNVVATYTATTAKRLRGGMPRYVRIRVTAGTGSVEVALGKAVNRDGKLTEVNAESRHSG